MELSRHILKEFADVSRGVEREDKTQYLRGTIKGSGEAKYVRIDGSESLTPISEIVDVKDGDRVLVTIENHEATILGNLTMPPSAYKEQEAIDKAEDAQGTASDAVEKAETAQTLAQSAGNKADAALVDATNASAAANQAKQDAAEAMTAADNASNNSIEAKQLATAAGQNAETARQEAALAQNAATAAQGEVTRIEGIVTDVKGDINTALEDVANQAAETAAIKETLSVEYAKKTEVSDVQAALTTEISKKVGELQTTVSQTYAAKNEVVEMEGRLQTQITQTAGEVTSVVGKVEQLESDTTEAQKKVDDALEKSAAAQVAANQAQVNATASQAAADAAKANAATATQKATEAAQNAATAAATAAAADKKVAAAQTDLNEAKQNLANTINRVDATEADIAEAQKKVETAQAAVTQAQKDAAEATLAANNAQTAANQAQNDATEAQNAATNAQKKADNAAIAAGNAQAAADKAQQDVAALTERVTSAETAISQNAEQIRLSATKTEEIGTKLENLNIGDENLINLSEIKTYNDATIDTSNYIKRGEVILTTSVKENSGVYFDFYNDSKPETYYVFSYDITALGSQPFNTIRGHIDVGFYTISFYVDGVDTKMGYPSTYTFSDSNVRKHHVEVYVELKNEMTSNRRIFIQPNHETQASEKYKIENLKLVEGNKYTNGWSPAPGDIKSEIDSTNSNLRNNYYSKTQTDAAIKVAADNVTTTVRTETTEQITNINKRIVNDNLISKSNVCIRSSTTDDYYYHNYSLGIDDIQELRGKTITVSVDIYCENAVGKRIGIEPAIKYTNGDIVYMGVWKYIDVGTTTMHERISKTFTIRDSEIESFTQNGLYVQGVTSGYCYVGFPKIEYGESATPYCLSRSDSRIGYENLISSGSFSPYGWNNDSTGVLSNYEKNGMITLTNVKNSAGFGIYLENLVTGQPYTLSYKLRKTSGNLKTIGGHLDVKLKRIYSLYIDNIPQTYRYENPVSTSKFDDTEWHTVDLTFVPYENYSGTGIYIQPNKSVTSSSVSVEIDGLKLVKGSIATDGLIRSLTDSATSSQVKQAQNDANEANGKADATEERVTVAESTLKQLSDSISMLVTDSNGSSMMTQTSDGWTFNIGAITNAIDNASNNIDSLASSLSQANHTINNLNNLANDLSKKTAYINMTTDSSGSPCIELGKAGNAFKVRITNTSVDFIEGSSKIAYVSNQALFIEKAIIKNELQIGEKRGFIWKTRSNGNLGLRWFG